MGTTKLHRICACCPEGLSTCNLGNTRADIVFLHGLGGDWDGTWKHKASNGNPEFFWPKELAKEYKDVYTVWSLQYPAALIDFQTKAYDQNTSSLLAPIDAALRGASIGERPFVFACHSLGGLMAKKLLIEAHRGGIKLKHLNLAGLAFYGTPHFGSDLARLLETVVDKAFGSAWETGVKTFGAWLSGIAQFPVNKITDLATNLRPATTEIIKELGATIALAKLNQDFSLYYSERWASKPFDLSIAMEANGVLGPLGMQVVKEDSADPYLRKTLANDPLIPLSVEADHFGVCKPNDRSHPAWQQLIAMIKTVETDILPFSEFHWGDSAENNCLYRIFHLLKTRDELRDAFVAIGLANPRDSAESQTNAIVRSLTKSCDIDGVCGAIATVGKALQTAKGSGTGTRKFGQNDVEVCKSLVGYLVAAWQIRESKSAQQLAQSLGSIGFEVPNVSDDYKNDNEGRGLDGKADIESTESVLFEFARAHSKRSAINLKSAQLSEQDTNGEHKAANYLKNTATVIPYGIIAANAHPFQGVQKNIERLVFNNQSKFENHDASWEQTSVNVQDNLSPRARGQVKRTANLLESDGRPLVIDLRKSALNTLLHRDFLDEEFRGSPLEGRLQAAFTTDAKFTPEQESASGQIVAALSNYFNLHDKVEKYLLS
jgi:pimeloyl-ACP methyl ester carboxylesterase